MHAVATSTAYKACCTGCTARCAPVSSQLSMGVMLREALRPGPCPGVQPRTFCGCRGRPSGDLARCWTAGAGERCGCCGASGHEVECLWVATCAWPCGGAALAPGTFCGGVQVGGVFDRCSLARTGVSTGERTWRRCFGGTGELRRGGFGSGGSSVVLSQGGSSEDAGVSGWRSRMTFSGALGSGSVRLRR